MRQASPLVSVIMSVYNSDKYLEEAIESILTQEFSDFEFIIINDASTDNSLKIIHNCMEKDGRIRLIENDSNIGLAISLNKGIEVSRGEYLARMDADDISLPGRLGMQIKFMENNPDIWILGGNHRILGEGGKFSGVSSYPENTDIMRWNMLLGNGLIVSNGATMLRKKVFDVVGKFHNFPAAQDFDLWTRFFFYEKLPILNISDVIYYYRKHLENTSVKSKSIQFDISNTIRANLCTSFLGKEVPPEIVQAYRTTSFSYPEIRKYILVWIAIYEKFMSVFPCDEASRLVIYSELMKRIGKYVSLNPIYFLAENRLCFFREVFNMPPQYGLNLLKIKLSHEKESSNG